jgi:hypothetical protein
MSEASGSAEQIRLTLDAAIGAAILGAMPSLAQGCGNGLFGASRVTPTRPPLRRSESLQAGVRGSCERECVT